MQSLKIQTDEIEVQIPFAVKNYNRKTLASFLTKVERDVAQQLVRNAQSDAFAGINVPL
jgi:hypothetical protein